MAFVLAGFITRLEEGGLSLSATWVVRLPQSCVLIRLRESDAMAIDEALRWLGVSAEGTQDEFDTLGLGALDDLRRGDD